MMRNDRTDVKNLLLACDTADKCIMQIRDANLDESFYQDSF